MICISKTKAKNQQGKYTAVRPQNGGSVFFLGKTRRSGIGSGLVVGHKLIPEHVGVHMYLLNRKLFVIGTHCDARCKQIRLQQFHCKVLEK